MKRVLATVAACLFALPAAAEPSAGVWKTEPGESGGYLHVSIAPCGAQVCGTILSAFDASGAVAADYAHTGKPIIWDMQARGQGSYRGGKIWAPDSDKTYNSRMSLSGNALKVEGCVIGICRAQTWTRVR